MFTGLSQAEKVVIFLSQLKITQRRIKKIHGSTKLLISMFKLIAHDQGHG